MFYDKFKQLCDAKGVSCNRAVSEIGLSNSISTKWKKTGATPEGATLTKIAYYFNVSTDELVSSVVDVFTTGINEDQGAKKMPTPSTEDGLSLEQREVLRLYNAASPALRAAALAVLKSAEAQDKAPDEVLKVE